MFLCSYEAKLNNILALPMRSQPSVDTHDHVVLTALIKSLYLVLERLRKHLSVLGSPFTKITGGS